MTQLEQKQNSAENDAEKSLNTDKIEKSPAEKRAARLDEINRESLSFKVDGSRDLTEIEIRLNQEFEKKMQEMEMAQIPIVEDTKKIIHRNMVDDLIEHAGKKNEILNALMFEKMQIEKDVLVDSFLDKVTELNPQINKQELRKILTSPEVLNLDRNRNRELVGITEENWHMLREQKQGGLGEILGKLLRFQLFDSECKHMLSDPAVEFVVSGEISVLGLSVKMEELNDSEIVGLGIDHIKKILSDLVNDQDGRVFQGTFLNVLVSEKCPYVLKVVREMESVNDEENQKRSMMYYPIFRNAIGSEFFPKQAILKSQSSEKMHVLQERQDFSKMIPLKLSTLDEFIQGGQSGKFRRVFGKKENRDKMERFLSGVENLYEKHQFVLDILGSNVFLGIDGDDMLDIRLVDCGGWQNDSENKWGDDLKVVREFIGKLRNFSRSMEIQEEFEKENFKNIEFKQISQLKCWDKLVDFDFAKKFAGLEIVIIDDEEKWRNVYGSNNSKSSHSPKTIILKREVFDRQDISDENLSWLIHEIGHIDFYDELGENLDDYMEKYYKTDKYAESEMEQRAFEKQFQFLKSLGKTRIECAAVIEKYLEKTFSENQEEERKKEFKYILKYINNVYRIL